MSALNTYVNLYLRKKEIEEMMEKVKEEAIEERKAILDKDLEVSGLKVSVVGERKNWNYKHVKVWQQVKARLSKIESMSKEAYENPDDVFMDNETFLIVEPAKLSMIAESLKLCKVKE